LGKTVNEDDVLIKCLHMGICYRPVKLMTEHPEKKDKNKVGLQVGIHALDKA